MDEWEDNIKNFKIAYKGLNISVTPKAHSLFYEIPFFIKKHSRPLGFYSEQKFETVHQDWKKTWSLYKRVESHNEHPKKLKDAVKIC